MQKFMAFWCQCERRNKNSLCRNLCTYLSCLSIFSFPILLVVVVLVVVEVFCKLWLVVSLDFFFPIDSSKMDS